jgi:hypothetical protein
MKEIYFKQLNRIISYARDLISQKISFNIEDVNQILYFQVKSFNENYQKQNLPDDYTKVMNQFLSAVILGSAGFKPVNNHN